MTLLLSLLGCQVEPPAYVPPPPVVPGAPQVGAAEAPLEMPIGTPLSGYTSRCTCMGGSLFDADDRKSAYAYKFIESTGVHTTPTVKVIWIDNGDDDLVWVKTDTIYSYDNLVAALEDELSLRTGEDLHGKVIHTTNHSHSGWGSFSDQKGFYLGSDKYNEEIFQRFVTDLSDVAEEAWTNRVPAKIGLGWALNWDPDNKVYRDRRGSNNDLVVWEDQADWVTGKDEHVALMRFDTLDDQPIAVSVTFGMHGILLDTDSTMASGDSGLAVEHALQEFLPDGTVVMFTQGAGGDASPAGSDDDFARAEALGLYAVDPLLELWEDTPTSADPIRLETAARSINVHRDAINVTRGGTVDWYYAPYNADERPDDVVFDSVTGELLGEIDEFNTAYGAAFCGSGDFDVPIGQIQTDAFPYSQCMEIELMSRLLLAFFDLEEEEIPLPLPHTVRAGTAATRIGPLQVRMPDGTQVSQDQLIGYFPGETTSMYVEQWRRRTESELGYAQALLMGYSMDHEGYLLIPEDWLKGGYEPDITFWGPLMGEHVMEGVLSMVDEVLNTDVHEDPDPWRIYQRTTYADKPLPTVKPDLAPRAGERLTAVPDWDGSEDGEPPRFWTPLDIDPDFENPEVIPRIQGTVQLAWIGGDPAVDFPNVVLERQNGSGAWEPVLTESGRIVDEQFTDILTAYTPNPLYPADADQTHYWWASWQAVNHLHDRTGLPEGVYRLHVTGKTWVGGNETWPWDTESYEVTSDSFEVVATTLTVNQDGAGFWLSHQGPDDGWRLIALDGAYRGHNPVAGPITVTTTDNDGSTQTFDVDIAEVANKKSRVSFTLPDNAVSVTFTDAYGNEGNVPVNQ